MKYYSEIVASIVLVEFYLGLKGLEIHYDVNGEEHTILATPEQACPLMQEIGMIQKYAGSGENMSVLVSFDDFNGYSLIERWISYERYIYGHEGLNKEDALAIAVLIEDKKQLQAWKDKILSIPSLIQNMGA